MYQILVQRKDLVPLTLESNWSGLTVRQRERRLAGADDSWKWTELKLVFDSLLAHLLQSSKLFLLVDGLDEYGTFDELNRSVHEDSNAAGHYATTRADRHLEIAEFFSNFALHKDVKLCVSSRPLAPFSSTFGEPHIRLEDLSSTDIKVYVDENLSCYAKMARLTDENPDAARQLSQEIVQKASGVFLWVRLVVRLVVLGLVDSDSISELQDLLRTLPEELGGRDGLYMRMLKDIKPNHLKQASHMFRIMQQEWNGISLLEMSFAQEDPSATIDTPISTWTRQMADKKSQIMEERLKSRCQGLLETYDVHARNRYWANLEGADPSAVDNLRMVRYVHLSVEEFLENTYVWNTVLREPSESRFNGSLSLLNACILKLKSISPRPDGSTGTVFLVYIWEIILDAMHHIAAAQKTLGRASQLHSLVDELDKTATALLAGWDQSGNFQKDDTENHAISQCHWTMTEPQERGGRDMKARDTFISFVVQAGLKTYVEAKLKHSGPKILEKPGRPVLDYAVAPHRNYTLLQYDRQWDGIGTRQADPSLVELLLRYGADPNERYPFGYSRYGLYHLQNTVWGNALLAGLDCLESTRGPKPARWVDCISRWAENVKLLINHGANVNLKIEMEERLSKQGNTVITAHSPLFYATRVLSHHPDALPEVTSLLLARGAQYRYGEKEQLRNEYNFSLDLLGDEMHDDTFVPGKLTGDSVTTSSAQQKQGTSKKLRENLKPGLSQLKSVFALRKKK